MASMLISTGSSTASFLSSDHSAAGDVTNSLEFLENH